MITGNEKDELIFDYLEGNLSEREKEAFLILKDENEMMEREVRLWQNAYLHEPLPEIDSLEKKLLIEPKAGGFFSRIYLNVLMLSFCVFISAEKLSKVTLIDAPVTHRISQAEIPKAPVIEIPKTIIKQLEQRKQVTYVITKTDEQREYAIFPTVPVLNEELRLVSRDALNVEVDFADVYIKSFSISKARKKWSRLQKRQLRKKLWNDQQTREANAFLKGNVPYVVPLNNNNF